ncbi:hypothetical protein [Mucilaginibacter ginsenosidivorax]|uniref:hypothetical protein n=1 Tax=Mucilaginibacter ginsenosidivorax TaxID=862126 RepID=UPI001863E755|nr:hypothetical protein [Mucilaginibacter ginsenosidivorax]
MKRTINEAILDANGTIDPHKIHLEARLVKAFSETDKMKELADATMGDTHTLPLHLKARQLLDDGRVIGAWKVLLM